MSSVFELEEPDVDVCKEKRTQKYLILMVGAFAACLGPLMLLRYDIIHDAHGICIYTHV